MTRSQQADRPDGRRTSTISWPSALARAIRSQARPLQDGRLATTRQSWIETGAAVAFTPNVKDVYGQNTEASDRSLSRRIRVLLAWNGPISVLRNNSFAGFAFGRSKLDPFDDNLAAADPAFEFIDAELEGLRAELTRTINALMEAIAEETYFSNANVEFSSVPAEYEITKPARFAAAVKRIHGAASDVCNAYDEFTRALRRKLGDEGVEPVPAAA